MGPTRHYYFEQNMRCGYGYGPTSFIANTTTFQIETSLMFIYFTSSKFKTYNFFFSGMQALKKKTLLMLKEEEEINPHLFQLL